MQNKALRLTASLGAVAAVTLVSRQLGPPNATTIGFVYLLVVLVLASAWGFAEASVASFAATLGFNYYFLPPVKTLTITDPQNWVALFSFLATALIASRLSAKAKLRAREALERQQDIERLYTFSRAILLSNNSEPFPKQLAQKLASVFQLQAAVLYDRRTDQIYRAGPSDFEGMDEQVKDAARHGTHFSAPDKGRAITAVRLGSEPIASLAVQGANMPDSALQSIANLVAIGLERARSEDLAHQAEAARRSEQLRTTLIDAMAHEFKTPLTSIKAATTTLLANPDSSAENRTELLNIADEEADRLKMLIDDAIDMARLDMAKIEIHPELGSLAETLEDLIAAMHSEVHEREITLSNQAKSVSVGFDRRLARLAFKQLLENAIKYSSPNTPVSIQIVDRLPYVVVEVRNFGKDIPAAEQKQIFDRFYRSPSVQRQVPGYGLGLSITKRIMQAHDGDLTVSSGSGETVFRLSFPMPEADGPAQ